MKIIRKSIISLIISLCMVLTMTSVVAFADSLEITAFEELAEDDAFKEVESGTTLTELGLPEELEAITTVTIVTGIDTTTVTTGAGTTVSVSNWVSNPDYKPSLEDGIYTFTPIIDLPSYITMKNGVTPPTIRVMKILPKLKLGTADEIKADSDFSGTGYEWEALTKTLTLTSDYQSGSIEFLNFGSEQITMKLDGDVTIDESGSGGNCIYNHNISGNTNVLIDLGKNTLTLITGGDDNEALDLEICTIENGTLVASLQGSGTENETASISISDFTIKNATVIATADSLAYGGIYADTLKLNQGAKLISEGKNGIWLGSATALHLASDDITLTAIGSSSAIFLDCDFRYVSGSNLKCWTNTEANQPTPVGEGTLLSSKSREFWDDLWYNSK